MPGAGEMEAMMTKVVYKALVDSIEWNKSLLSALTHDGKRPPAANDKVTADACVTQIEKCKKLLKPKPTLPAAG